MKKNVRNILSAALVIALLAVLLIIPVAASESDLTPARPTATVTDIPKEELDENTPLSFALKFAADEVTEEQLAFYKDWYADFVLTVNKTAVFNVNSETADGYLAGQYDAWSENWVSVPFEDVELKANESLKIMEYAATLMGQPGLKLTYNDVYTAVKEFDCGVFFAPAFLEENPDLVVTLELRMYNPEDETESYPIGKTYAFEAMDLFAAAVVSEGVTEYYLALADAIAAAKDGDTIEILKDQTLTVQHVIEKNITIDGNGFELTTSTVQKLIRIKANVTINDLTVTNTVSGGRCIETRVGGITLNLNNVTLTATKGSTQALTIGGNAGTDGDVIVNLNGCHIDSGSVGYGIVTFNPVKLTVENSTAVCGYGALYLKPADSSVGSAGSVVEIKGSTLRSDGRNDGYAFGTIIIQDNNITVNVDEKSELIATNPENSTGRQFAIMISDLDKSGNPAVYTGITVNVAGKITADYLVSNLTSLTNTVYVPAQYKDAIETEYFTTAADNGLIRVWATHDHELNFVKPNDATCTKDGNVEHYNCSICNNNFADETATKALEDVTIPAAHAFGDWMPKKDATCDEEGHEDHFYCSACGLYKMLSTDGETYVDATEEEVMIPALGHKAVFVEYKEKTCTEDGIREHWYCKVCDGYYKDEELTGALLPEDVVIPAGHRYKPVAAQAATCTEDGNIEHYRCDCGYMVVIDGEALKEVTSKDVTVPAKGHTMTKVETKTPTCTGDGNMEYYNCSVCKKNFADEKGEKELTTVVDAAKGHKLVKVAAKAATCTETGNTEHYTCDNCDKLFADEKGATEITAEKTVIAAKGHTEVAVAGKTATCTESGLTEGKKCSVCGTVTVKQETIAALGHKLTKVEAKAATYTEAGNIEHYACACGKLFSDAEGKNAITDVVIPQLIKVEEEKAEVSTGAVDNAIADAKEKAEETGKPVEVVIEVPKAPVVEKPEDPEDKEETEEPEEKPQEVVKVELPVQALENVAKEEANLTVVMPSVTVTVDTEALKTVTEQAAGNTVALVVEQVKEETLTEKQQEAVKKYDVAVTIKAEFICQETQEKIWTEENNADKEKSGSVTVKMPFTPAEGSKGSDYTVLYIADDGSVKEIKTAFEDGHLVFALEHFSEYVVVNTKTTSVTPDTSDRAMLVPFAMLLVLSVAGMAVMTAGKKKLL